MKFNSRLKFYLFVFVWFSLFAGQCLANMLDNPGFETGNFAGWDDIWGPGWQIQSNEVFAGNFSAENIIPDVANNDHFGGIFQEETVSPGITIYAALQTKTIINPQSSAIAGLKLEFYNGSTQILQEQTDIGGQNDWQQLYLAVEAPAGTTSVKFFAFVWATQGDNFATGGEVYFDEAILTTDYIAPPPEPYCLLNPDFQNGLHEWTQYGPNWQIDPNGYLGGLSAMNTMTTSSLEYWVSLYQLRDLSAGELIRACAKVKTSFNQNIYAAAGLLVTFLDTNGNPIEDGNGNIVEGKDEVTGSQDWTQLYVTATAPATTVEVKLEVFLWADAANPSGLDATAWFDGVRLVLPSHGTVRTKNRSLEVDFDGNNDYEPYFIKAVGYSPFPIGRYPEDFGNNMYDDTQILERDFPLLQAMNANSVRIWGGNDIEQANGQMPDKITQTTLDTAEMYNLKVIAGFRMPNDIDYTDPAIRQDFIEDFKDYVNDFKDHPAILSWCIGNENNFYLPTGQLSAFYSLVNQMAYEARKLERETYHPVALANGDILYIGDETYEVTDKYMIDLDIWGVNVYRGNSFLDLFSEFATKSDKPLWISEYGIDAWHTNDPQNPSNGYEDQDTQAQWAEYLWDETVANNDVAIGASLMEYCDEWWKPNPQGWHSTTHDYGGFEKPSSPDGFSNEEWFGVMEIEEDPLPQNPDIVTPRLVYTALQTKFAMETPYILHLGIENGEDTFPQEIAQQSYYTAAASSLMTIKYLYYYYNATQSYIYDTYHIGPTGEEMDSTEVMTALNDETDPPYSYGHHSHSDQLEAIKDFIFWIDYLPAGGLNCPAVIPKNEQYQWGVIRGFVTDQKPYAASPPFPDFTFYGLWANDPSQSGLGFNMYQTPQAFQNDYLSIEGEYHSIVEPPPENFEHQAFKNIKMRLAPPVENKKVQKLLSAPWESKKIKTVKKLLVWDEYIHQSEINLLKNNLPLALRKDILFMDLFEQTDSLTRFDVFDLTAQKAYCLLALNPKCQKQKNSETQKGTNIIIEINPNKGSFLQATWTETPEIYLRVSRNEAIALARQYLSQKSKQRNFLDQYLTQVESVRLVWSRNFATSRFHPSYEITFNSWRVVFVHPDGSVTQDNSIAQNNPR